MLLLAIASLSQAASGETAHAHHWQYEAAGDTITAHCDADCPITEGLALRLFAPEDLTYDGNIKPAKINGDFNPAAFGGVPAVTYADAEGRPLESEPIDAGTYTASIEPVPGVRASVTYTVNASPLVLPQALPEPIDISYDGRDHALVVMPDALPEGCAGVRYGLNGDDWSETIPAVAEAGAYPVYIKYLGDENHMDCVLDPPLIAVIAPAPYGIVLTTMTAQGTNALNVTWKAAQYVDGYDVFLKKCKGSERYQCVATAEGQDNTRTTVTGLSEYTNYKGGVRAWVMKDGSKQYVLDPSPVVHVITGGICKGEVNPTSLKLNHANVTLKLGRSLRVNGTIKSALKGRLLKHVARLRFVSSDPSVATVNSKGDVEAVGGGSCQIYALTNNGIWQSVNVTVDPSPESVWFYKAKNYVSVGKKLDLGASLKLWPGKSQTTLTWTSSNTSVATVTDKGVVTGRKKGKATISAVASNGKKATISIKVK